MDRPYRVVSDVPLVVYSTHPTPGSAHKAAITLSRRWARSHSNGATRVERWVAGKGWIEVSTYVAGNQR
jgi:hypothetical protein